MPRIAKSSPSEKSAANLGFEAKLWLTADKLRNNMDAAEYKHGATSLRDSDRLLMLASHRRMQLRSGWCMDSPHRMITFKN